MGVAPDVAKDGDIVGVEISGASVVVVTGPDEVVSRRLAQVWGRVWDRGRRVPKGGKSGGTWHMKYKNVKAQRGAVSPGDE